MLALRLTRYDCLWKQFAANYQFEWDLRTCEPVLIDQVNKKLKIEHSFGVPAQEVLDYLKADEFHVSDKQTCPPVALLQEVADRVRDTRHIGPALWTNAAFTEKLAPHLIIKTCVKTLLEGSN